MILLPKLTLSHFAGVWTLKDDTDAYFKTSDFKVGKLHKTA